MIFLVLLVVGMPISHAKVVEVPGVGSGEEVPELFVAMVQLTRPMNLVIIRMEKMRHVLQFWEMVTLEL